MAREPDAHYHFHRGPDYAHDFLGYDSNELASLPRIATECFAGVGNPLAIGPVASGATVLDHACGGGMDLLLAARRVGPGGRAIGVDMTPAMVRTATEATRQARLDRIVAVHEGFYESLPVPDASVDVVISNGVLNLAPDKRAVLDEVARVLKPGGSLYLADVVVQRELTLEARSNPELWAACIAGALVESELPQIAARNRHERLRRLFPQARAIVYGHSHRLVADCDREPWVLNPGAAGRARTFGGPSCVVLDAAEHHWELHIERFEPLTGHGR